MNIFTYGLLTLQLKMFQTHSNNIHAISLCAILHDPLCCNLLVTVKNERLQNTFFYSYMHLI